MKDRTKENKAWEVARQSQLGFEFNSEGELVIVAPNDQKIGDSVFNDISTQETRRQELNAAFEKLDSRHTSTGTDEHLSIVEEDIRDREEMYRRNY